MKLALKKASTDVTLYVFVPASNVTTGAGLTGLAYNTESLVCYYVRPGAAAAVQALATQTVTGAHSDGGFVEVDADNMPGVYRLDLKDAVCATGVNSVAVMLKGAANMAPVLIEIQLTTVDLNEGVRAGLTCLPAVASGTSGGLLISGTATDCSLEVASGVAQADVKLWKTATAPDMPDNFAATVISAGGVVNADVKNWDGDAVPAAATVQDVWEYDSGTKRTLSNATNITSTDGEITLDGDGYVSVPATQVVASVSGAVGSISTGGIAAGSFQAGAINSDAIGTGAIDADAIASDAITVDKIDANAIGADQIAAAAVTKIAGGVLTTPANKLYTDASGRVRPRLEQIIKGNELANFHFPMRLAADGSLATGVGASLAGKYVQDGQTSLSDITGTITEVTGTGIYMVDLAAAETNCDVLTLVFTADACSTSVITLITQSQS